MPRSEFTQLLGHAGIGRGVVDHNDLCPTRQINEDGLQAREGKIDASINRDYYVDRPLGEAALHRAADHMCRHRQEPQIRLCRMPFIAGCRKHRGQHSCCRFGAAPLGGGIEGAARQVAARAANAHGTFETAQLVRWNTEPTRPRQRAFVLNGDSTVVGDHRNAAPPLRSVQWSM